MVDPRLVQIALEHTDGGAFENFFKHFFCSYFGPCFAPLGGIHDGGADAVLDDDGVVEGRRPYSFFQATRQEDHRAKIRATVKRLREVGREVRQLTYATSRIVSKVDIEQDKLGEELDIFLIIRDREWFAHQINRNEGTQAAFTAYLRPLITYLLRPGTADLLPPTQNFSSRTLAIFLRQEVEKRSSRSSLIESVTDTLILWSLEGTDPDQGKFKTRDEILQSIEEVLPSARKFVRGVLDHRLKVLNKKANPTGREINFHKDVNGFCLPFETRQLVADENMEDEALRIEVLSIFEDRIEEILEDEGLSIENTQPSQIAKIAYDAVCNTYEHRGIELAAIWEGKEADNLPTVVADEVSNNIAAAGITGSDATAVRLVAIGIIRKAFYSSEEAERLLFGKLNKTYSLMFTLRIEPRVVEYFQSMKGDFELFIGSDIFIRAMSEKYLEKKDQTTGNLLEMLQQAGAKLILTRPVVEEVASHLAATDFEFQNHIMRQEPYLSMEMIREVPKILLRAYLYARKQPVDAQSRPAGWRSYIEGFCTYENLHSSKGQEDILQYLIRKYDMEFVDTPELVSLVDQEELEELTEKILPTKVKTRIEEDKSRMLAFNDALMVLSVYARRKENKEQYKAGPFGFKSWWLTHEHLVQKCAVEVLQRNDGIRFIMRPEFILNFIALAPAMDEVRRSFSLIFPTMLGLRLSNRINDAQFHGWMRKLSEGVEQDDARAEAVVADFSNKLKSDQLKRYEVSLEDDPFYGDPVSEL